MRAFRSPDIDMPVDAGDPLPSSPESPITTADAIARAAAEWYPANARDLPWRRPETTAWAILVSEIMLQQTPVSRVERAWREWLQRWPTPAALAAAEPADAIRAWGRLGYPRRALRIHECANALVRRHNGQVPADVDALLALPGVGTYTARAVAAFAFGQRHPVVDTNVRRLLSRVVLGVDDTTSTTTARDLALAGSLLPVDPATAARVSAAFMELGAVVCVARNPKCTVCPLTACCGWRMAGARPADGPTRRPQAYAGTDRQVRGLLLAVLREAAGPVTVASLDAVWHDDSQRARAMSGLLADGLMVAVDSDRFALPGRHGSPATTVAPLAEASGAPAGGNGVSPGGGEWGASAQA